MRIRSSALTLLVCALATSACGTAEDDDPAVPTPGRTGGSASTPTSECISAEADGVTLRVVLPEGFRDGTDATLLDQLWGRPPADGEGNSDVVGLDAPGPEDSDPVIVQKAMAGVASGAQTGGSGYERAVDRVGEQGLTEITWTDPDRMGDGDQLTGSVRLVEVEGARFTIGVIAATDDFDELQATVEDSQEVGSCPG